MTKFSAARLWILLSLLAILFTACQSGDSDAISKTGLELVDASVGNLVWDDYHPNGILEPGEPGLAGVTVKLIDLGPDNRCNTSDDSVLQEVVTDAQGHYRIDAEPGVYCLQFVPPAGDFVFSAKDQGSNDALDSDADPDTGYTDLVTFQEDVVNNTVDAAMHPSKTCIGDFVWNDLDRDGIQDENEPGIEGVTVQLVDPGSDGRCGTADDRVLESTTTDENGFYAFNNLEGGDYCVQFVRPDGFTPSPQGQGDDEALDSNPDPATGITEVISVETGETEITIDAGYYEPDPGLGSIGDTVFRDTNGNRTQDAGEPGIEGVTLRLTTPGPDNVCDTDDDPLLATRSTDANGKYLFGDLDAGTYCVDVVSRTLPSSLSLTTDNDPERVNLGGGEDFLDADFGYKPPTGTASLGDRVFNDLNRNGVQDANEPGIDGLEVMLLDPGDDSCEDGDTVLDNVVTNSSGIYSFDGLAPGDYCVMFNLPDNFVFSPANQGGDDSRDSDADPSSGKSQIVTLDAGETDETVDAGGYKPEPTLGSIGDRVFEDLNGNGIQNAGEPGVPGAPVQLKDCNNNVLETTTTDNSGNYLFSSLAAGCYRIGVSRNGFSFSPANQGDDDSRDSDVDPTTGMTGDINLGDGEDDLSNDAGVFTPASLGDKVFNDTNRNGVQDPGEPGLGGLEVMLLDPGDNSVCEEGDAELDSTTTDGGGNYSFDDLTPGQPYCVMFNLPDGFVFSPQDQGGNDATDSDANPSNGKSQVVILEPGENDDTVDAGGYEQPVDGNASLGDRVFNDLNRNGVQDAGEPGIAGLEVMLLDPGDDNCEDGDTVLDNTTTGPGGIYRFTDLTAGDYCVMFNLPDGFVFSPQDQGGNDATDSDANPSNGKSQVVTLEEDEDNPTVDAGVNRPGEPNIDLTKTVGTDANSCATTDSISVLTGTTVYYCYTVTNTGNVALTVHDLSDDQLGTILSDFAFNLTPGASVNTVTAGVTASADITETTTNTATWTGTTEDGREVSATDTATVNTTAPVCSLDLNVTADPVSITPGPTPGCGFGEKDKEKPLNLTFRYTGGDCSASNNSQDDKFECSGSATSETVSLSSKKDKNVFNPSTVSLGEEFTLSGEDGKKPESEITVGSQQLDIHMSCSAPIRVGDVYGALTLVAFNGKRATDDKVTYEYEVTNNGDDVTDATISDSFGSVGDDFDLGAGESISFTRTRAITSTTTNTVNVTSLLGDGQTCSATESATVEVLPPPLSCEDGKPQRLVFEYTGESCSASQNTQGSKFECSGSPGSGTVSISLEEDSDKMSINPGSANVGDLITLTGRDGKLKSSAELNVGGQFLDIHTSCSAPLQVGDQFGSLILREFVPEND